MTGTTVCWGLGTDGDANETPIQRHHATSLQREHKSARRRRHVGPQFLECLHHHNAVTADHDHPNVVFLRRGHLPARPVRFDTQYVRAVGLEPRCLARGANPQITS